MLEAPTTPTVPIQPDAARRAGVRVVIVHYRSLSQTRNLLARLQADIPELQAIIVANHSGDGSDATLAAELAEQTNRRVAIQSSNLGFGAGCNVGIQLALSDSTVQHVLLLNPDVEPKSGFLDHLLGAATRHPDAAVIGAKIVSMDGKRVLYENGRIPRVTLSGCQIAAPAGRVEFATDFVSGACMLIDAAALRHGLRFDESFFLYVEDLDLCRQVQSLGKSLWVDTRAVVRHEDGGTQQDETTFVGGMRPTQLVHLARGKVIFAKKWFGRSEFWLSVAFALTVKPLVALVLWRRIAPVAAHLRGVRDGIRAARAVTKQS